MSPPRTRGRAGSSQRSSWVGSGHRFLGIFGSDFELEPRSTIKANTNGVAQAGRDLEPGSVEKSDRAEPWKHRRRHLARHHAIPPLRLAVGAEELPREADRVRLSADPGNPDSQPAFAICRPAGRFDVVAAPAKAADGDVVGRVGPVVDVVARQEQRG